MLERIDLRGATLTSSSFEHVNLSGYHPPLPFLMSEVPLYTLRLRALFPPDQPGPRTSREQATRGHEDLSRATHSVTRWSRGHA